MFQIGNDASRRFRRNADEGRLLAERSRDALEKALDDENVRKRLQDIGDIPGKARRGQQALVAIVKSDLERWTPVIKAANVKMEYESPACFAVGRSAQRRCAASGSELKVRELRWGGRTFSSGL
jgi:hypothetical protein